ncbi:MAG: hypothetical protein ACOH2E_08495 [Candidatus Paracaedibacter sp.]
MPRPCDNFPPFQKKPPLLKLVVSNPPLIKKKTISQMTIPNTGFTAEIQMRSPSYYALVARDAFHCLDYELILKIHDHKDEEELETRSAICHFPNILVEELDASIGEDEIFYGMIIIQFQMKILKQMLLFCGSHNIINLVIYADETSEGHALGIYQSLAIYEDKFPTTTGVKTKMIIPASQKTSDKLTGLMEGANYNFREALWRNQRTNYAIKAYLKADPGLKFFS